MGPFLFLKLDNLAYLCTATTYISWKESVKMAKRGIQLFGNYIYNSSTINTSETLYNIGRCGQSVGLVRLALIYYRRALQSCDNQNEFERQQINGMTLNIHNQESKPLLTSLWGKAQKRSCVRNISGIFLADLKYILTAKVQTKYGC